ncbi:MAG: IclR family transcriptional regulator [Rubrivivax sp.]|nr:IclR family transcriptional regulator [Rubrivivax sp.]
MPSPPPAQRGIQSIEVGGQLLRALAHHGRPLALKDLAQEAGMAPAKAHPYLVSFGKLGLIEQDPVSGRYGLGPLAMQLGLISLQQLDPVALATPVIEQLASRCGHTAAVAVWGNRGATIVRIAPPPRPVHVSMRHGTVMSLRGTASGRLFAAWLPRSAVLQALRDEARADPHPKGSPRGMDTDFAAALETIRREGLSRVRDLLLPGIGGIAAPVFDGQGRLVLALTVIGPSALLEASAGEAVSRPLLDAAQALSARLGGRAGRAGP